MRAGLGMQIENLDDASMGDKGVAAAGTLAKAANASKSPGVCFR